MSIVRGTYLSLSWFGLFDNVVMSESERESHDGTRDSFSLQVMVQCADSFDFDSLSPRHHRLHQKKE